ncbi:hypothetical protein EYF80_038083 [Liparis tanakae]|uniref:Uncharacterized protein n=1 Tax=Liparis tanakae TaxID=230148 RepID=A0A4Z2GFR2_9TELE|nr:hypothetical protein EYF80_038083 [Liparis tanakae]
MIRGDGQRGGFPSSEVQGFSPRSAVDVSYQSRPEGRAVVDVTCLSHAAGILSAALTAAPRTDRRVILAGPISAHSLAWTWPRARSRDCVRVAPEARKKERRKARKEICAKSLHSHPAPVELTSAVNNFFERLRHKAPWLREPTSSACSRVSDPYYSPPALTPPPSLPPSPIPRSPESPYLAQYKRVAL